MACLRFSFFHPSRRGKSWAMLIAVVLATLAGMVPAQAADTTPTDPNPGPAGDFTWKGFNWEKRFWGGAPQYNKVFAAGNVGNPDPNGYVTLNLTNPTGDAPVGAEFQSTRQGFGYGTYSTTVEKDRTTLQKEVVWGCLFTYDPVAEPGYNEIDLCEASAWGGGAAYGQSWPVSQGHGYWFDATKPAGQGNNTVTFDVTNSPITTHRMVWEPGRITFETFAGEGYTGPLLKRTVLEGATVPVPAKEQIHFNLWVTGGGAGDPAHVKPESVVVRDFSFTDAAAPAPSGQVSAIKLSASTTKSKSVRSTALTWSGATGTNVTLWTNNTQKSVPNTGSFTTSVKGGSTTTYKICDASACSNPVIVTT
ncbi:hypothetical protein [Arthrobacter sp. B1I2]|uniref:hypothetical protein n=1 Tax=Arthrobacter sp. B1I2 TaxID=3042263 RepID=UPI002783E763|nr:hypothetical protein [Arthrobacter sp. B1I2]MDQ0730694.1 hypothetical protein [Arthrobacter sp. B1I2]